MPIPAQPIPALHIPALHGPALPIPAVILSALRGGSGKTLLSLGLVRALVQRGLQVQPFKKGPDYIDAAWLSLAVHRPAAPADKEAQRVCRNLDPYFLPEDRLRACFVSHSQGADLAVIEGNRGLFDGRDLQGSCSTATLARNLQVPVVLSLDCTKMTRTAAAVVHGMATFAEGVRIGGVVLNHIATDRQAALIRASIEHYTDIPVLGAVPRLRNNPLPERHMGLVACGEGAQCADSLAVLDTLASIITDHVDVDAVLTLAHSAAEQEPVGDFWPEVASPVWAAGRAPRIGYVRDSALWFYYAENLEALERAGARLIPLSVLHPQPWPSVDGLYLGGGFPEEVAEDLSHSPQLAHIARLSAAQIPIYAECGGFMILARSIVRAGRSYPMAGIFPVSTHFYPKPQGLGYVEARVTAPNVFHPQGALLRGHEFHYSRAVYETEHCQSVLQCSQGAGTGMGKGRDGLLCGQTFASYMHIYAPALPHWAERFVGAAAACAARRPAA